MRAARQSSTSAKLAKRFSTTTWRPPGCAASQLEAIDMAAGSVAGTSKEKMIRTFSEKMHAARSEASALAARGEYEAAVKVLEPMFKSAPYQLMSLLR